MMRLDSVTLVIKTLNDAKVRYLVVGGLAVNAHGYVRLTIDVDLLVQLHAPNILSALRSLATLGYRPMNPVTFEEFAQEPNRKKWIEEKRMTVLKLFSDTHRETGIDVFVSEPLPFDEAYTRLKYYPISEAVSVPVCSYRDLVDLKLQASRPKDLLDVQELKKIRGDP